MAKTRWDETTGKRVTDERIDAFLADIDAVCKKHRLSISHEDGQGGFEVEAYDKLLVEWLGEAAIGRTVPRRQ